MRTLALSDDILMQVEKPARYIGNEINMVKKDWQKVDVRFCMCFPDVYEIGMSHLGIQILYDMFNQWEDTYCERVYSPWPDLDKILREKKIPLFALESQQPIRDFDFLGITIQYEMCYTNILQILDLSEIPLLGKRPHLEMFLWSSVADHVLIIRNLLLTFLTFFTLERERLSTEIFWMSTRNHEKMVTAAGSF